MAEPGRPANPVPGETTISAPETASVDPRAAVMEPRGTGNLSPVWLQGALNLENQSFLSAEQREQMLCLSHQISALLHVRAAWVLAQGVQLLPTDVPQMLKPRLINPKYEMAVETYQFGKWMLENPSDSLHGMLMELQDAHWWRNQLADLIWREQEGGEHTGKFCLDRMPVYGPHEYNLFRKEGRWIGAQSVWAAPGKDGKIPVYPIEKFGLYFFRPNNRHRLGTELASICATGFYIFEQMLPEWMKHLTRFSDPSVALFAPENTLPMVPLLDKDGNDLLDKDGNKRMVPPQKAMMAGVTQHFRNGSVHAFPGGSRVEMLAAQDEGRQFIACWRELHSWFAVAILGTEQLTEPQQYGSNATAKTGAETAQHPVWSDRKNLGAVVRGIVKSAVQWNFKKQYWDVVPRVTLGDERSSVAADLLKTIVNATGAGDIPELFGDVARQAGFTDNDIDAMRQRVIAGEPALAGTVAGSNGQGASGAA